MKIIFLVLIAFFLSSCKESKPLTLAIALTSECYWDVVGDKQVIGGVNSCYRFLPDGRCYFYYYNFYDKKKTDSIFHYDDDDVVVPDIWSVIGNTLLIARGTRYRVLSYDKDSLLVQGYKQDTMVLRKNCETFKGR